jgi:hypothetical protein
MKTKPAHLLASLCGVCVLAAIPPSRAATAPVSGVVAAASSNAPELTRAEALKLVDAAKKYEAHPPPASGGEITKPKILMPDFDIATAPPAPRPEVKPESPGSAMVWVAGHYMPVKGEWRWVKGEWATPPLAISVWIPARYDEEKKHWYPGYWQPDIPSSDPMVAPSAKEKAESKAKPGY